MKESDSIKRDDFDLIVVKIPLWVETQASGWFGLNTDQDVGGESVKQLRHWADLKIKMCFENFLPFTAGTQ